MPLTMAEKIKIVMGRRGMSLAQLAQLTGQSRQNLSNKMARGNFAEKDLQIIAAALGCTYQATLIMDDTGEAI